MSITQYKNIDSILSTTKQMRASRISDKDDILLTKTLTQTDFGLSDLNDDVVELHLYTVDGLYINGNHKVDTWSIADSLPKTSEYYESNNKKIIKLDVYSDMSVFDYRNIPLKIIYNFHRDIVGSFLSDKKLYVKSISSSRREIRLKLEGSDDTTLQNNYDSLFTDDSTGGPRANKSNLLLNFGSNVTALVINYVQDLNNECILKLYSPLDDSIEVSDKCHITTEIIQSVIETFTMFDSPIEKIHNKLSGPNFNIETDFSIRNDTPYTSWDDILSINLSSTQKILDNMSSDINTIRGNIDYSEPSNFVHYSNLTVRLKNFYNKVQRIEGYDVLIDTANSILGELGDTRDKYIASKNLIISEFDDFEKWMWFSPPLEETTYDGYNFQGIVGKINPYPKPDTIISYPEQSNWDVWADSWDQSNVYWGKNGGSETFYQVYPYINASSSDEYSISWMRQNLVVAEEYDRNNISSLRKTIPDYILNNTYNDDYVKFIDMISHHFDILWLYITYLSRFNKREHNPYNAFPDKMLYDVTRDFGWMLSNGSANSEIGKYELGITTDDTKIQPQRDGKVTKSDRERTHEIWRRILSNLPYIYKSKGTVRGVEAIINSYGIPSTILKPLEYSGTSTKTTRQSTLEFDKHTYSIQFGDGKYLTIPWDEFIEN